MPCLFCSIVAKEIPAHVVFENNDVVAFLDIAPVSQGHTLVIPKVHAEHLSLGSREDACKIMGVVYDLAPKILKAVGADGYNLSMNHGRCAGQVVMHTHLHIIPRKNDPTPSFTKSTTLQDELVATAQSIRNILEA